MNKNAKAAGVRSPKSPTNGLWRQQLNAADPTNKPWPPYAALATRRHGRLLLILTGSLARQEAARRVAADRRWDNYAAPFAVLPWATPPQRYRWDFVAGRDLGIKAVGNRESDVSMIHLAQLTLAAGAEIVAVVLSGDRLEIFVGDDGGQIWRVT